MIIFILLMPFIGFTSTEIRKQSYSLESRGGRDTDLTLRAPAKIIKKKKVKKTRNIQADETQRSKQVLNRLDNLVLYPNKNAVYSDLEVNIGDLIEIVIEDHMIGYASSLRRVRAKITQNNKISGLLLGNVSMDKKTKELVVDFDQLQIQDQTYKIKSVVRLKGRHETKFWTYFWATVGANAVGGFADASKDRDYTIFGEKPVITPQNVAINSVAEGAKAGANIFAEELKNYPEFTVVLAPVRANALIIKEPTL